MLFNQAGKFPRKIKPATGAICAHLLHDLKPSMRDNAKTPGQKSDELIARRKANMHKNINPAPGPINLEKRHHSSASNSESQANHSPTLKRMQLEINSTSNQSLKRSSCDSYKERTGVWK